MLKRIKTFFIALTALILTLIHCSPNPILTIEDILLCSDQFRVYNFSSFPPSESQVYSVELQILSISYLPVVLTLHNANTSLPVLDFSSEQFLKSIDMTSLSLDKKIQKLYLSPKTDSYMLAIRRMNLNQFRYFNNIDRNIQKYKGNNKQQLLSCTFDIKFTIRVTNIQNHSYNLEVLVPPLYQADCYNSAQYDQSNRKCDCGQHFGMPSCQTYFEEIQSIDQIYRKVSKPQTKYYYYYEPKQSFFEEKQTVEFKINLKGALTQNFTYNQRTLRPQFYILWNLQQRQDVLKVSSYFNQMSPAQISSISMKKGQRLVFTIYKPIWGVEQVSEVSISTKNSALSQFIIILIATTCTLTAISVIVFVVYLIYSRNKRNRDEIVGTMVAAMPIWRKNKTINSYFDIDRYFPTITFKELQTAMNQSGSTSSGQNQKLSCAICLQVFQLNTQVKGTFCLHIFHEKCLSQWILRQPSCPLCRCEYMTESVQSMEQLVGLSQQLSVCDRYAKIWKTIKNKQNKQSLAKTQMESSHKIRPPIQQIQQ